MRKSTTLAALIVLSQAAVAAAQDGAPAAPAATPPPAVTTPLPEAKATRDRRFYAGVSVMPMVLGKLKAHAAGMTEAPQAAATIGLGITVGYEIVRGLSLGLAPQVVMNTGRKEHSGDSGKEYDLMARIAYSYTIPEVVSLYAEVLPGYSILYPSFDATTKGLVVAFGGGISVDIAPRYYANLGAGYQLGLQNQTATAYLRPSYVRVTLGAGVKF